MTGPKIGVCGLTGFGNAIVRTLVGIGHRPQFVVTRREAGPFPYYPETDLQTEARALGIPCFHDVDGETHAITAKPDLLIVATYHRILSDAVRSSAGLALNFHPSLLPRYRGPNPFFWVLRHGESTTGLTVHMLTSALDAGEVVWQRALEIQSTHNQGTLRRQLAALAKAAVPDLLLAFAEGGLAGQPQRESDATYFGKPTEADRTLDMTQDLAFNLRVVRAATPYPGAIVGDLVADEVLGVWRTPEAARQASCSAGQVLVKLADGAMLLSTKANAAASLSGR